MKTSLRFILGLSGLGAGLVAAAPLKEGKLTRVINDVKVLPVESSPVAAKAGALITGRTAVSTGAKSRAELRFSDDTLTRLGANSIFRMDQKTRTVDLQKGVILLQVPKQLGGATVRTAAVTAAVTGTTVLFEYTADGYIKIIVIEGEVDVFLNKQKNKFRTLKAGDLWMTRADDENSLPLPVQVDLARLQRTSKLLNTDDFAPLGNVSQIQRALKDQDKKLAKGELLNTAFQIEGRGRNVTLLLADRDHISTVPVADNPTVRPPGTPPGTPGGTPPVINPPVVPPVVPPVIPPNRATDNPGIIVFENQSTLDSSAPSFAYSDAAGGFVSLPGTVYFPGQDDAFGAYMYDDPQAFLGIDTLLAAANSWSVLKADEIYLSGNPIVNVMNGPPNLIVGAIGDVNFTEFPPVGGSNLSTFPVWDLSPAIASLVFTSLSGSINFADFELNGSSQNVGFYADGPTSDVNIIGIEFSRITLPDGSFEAAAGRDFIMKTATIEAKTIDLAAENNIEIGELQGGGTRLAASESITLRAKQSVTISDSSQLLSLTQLDNPQILVEAMNGNVNLQGASVEGAAVDLISRGGNVSLMGATISAQQIKARVFGTGGELLISNAILGNGTNASNLIRLYGEGAQGVRFVGDTTLRGSQVEIAGPTVTIDPGSQVRVLNPTQTRVYSNSHLYNNQTNGNFVDLGGAGSGSPVQVDQRPYNQRPNY